MQTQPSSNNGTLFTPFRPGLKLESTNPTDPPEGQGGGGTTTPPTPPPPDDEEDDD